MNLKGSSNSQQCHKSIFLCVELITKRISRNWYLKIWFLVCKFVNNIEWLTSLYDLIITTTSHQVIYWISYIYEVWYKCIVINYGIKSRSLSTLREWIPTFNEIYHNQDVVSLPCSDKCISTLWMLSKFLLITIDINYIMRSSRQWIFCSYYKTCIIHTAQK